jgi:nicotinate-nucleotide pyrophosphorylase (carboxylating)
LDNMSIKTINRAVRLKKDPKIKLEVSGNINLKNVKKIAGTGVELISIGSLTHSVKTVDSSLEIL